MAVPALRIPMGLDTETFKRNIEEAKSKTAEVTEFITRQFAKQQLKPLIDVGQFTALTAVGVPAAQSMARSLAPVAAGALAVFAAFELVTGVVRSAREQIALMVEIADKAANFNVSPQFLQQFEGVSRNLKVTIEDLDGALQQAFRATRDVTPIDLSKFETANERITQIEFALRVYNDQLARAANTRLEGLVLFRDADNQEQKVRAVLTAMVELERIGQRAAALDIGEKMFGFGLVDRIRQGKTSADEILGTMEKLRASQDGLFSNELVRRAKDVDDELQKAEDRLSRALKPAWDDIASIVLTIKGYWADVVDLIAKAVEYVNSFGGSSQKAIPAVTVADNKPSRGTGAAPTRRATDSASGRDAFTSAVENIEKRIATLRADTAATFQNAAAQAQLRAEFQELTALKRVDGGVTQEQINAYEQFRKTMTASEALMASNIRLTKEQEAAFLNSSHGIRQATKDYYEAQDQLQKLNSASAQIGSALSASFADAVVEGRNLNEVMSNLLNTFAKMAINSTFSSIFNPPSSGGLSPFAGLLKGFGIPGFAGGTDYAPGGLAWVGERGPELVNLPRGARVIPNDVVRGGGGAMSISYAPQIDARGASVEAVARLEQMMMRDRAEFATRVVRTVQQARGARAL